MLGLLLLHLGSELIYLLRQRLTAHQVPAAQRQSALFDVLTALLDADNLVALTGQQQNAATFSVVSMKNWVERLVGRSAIRVPSDGMDKLFDMIWMVAKYQLVNITYAHEWLSLIDNHLDNLCGVGSGRWWGSDADNDAAGKMRTRLHERRMAVDLAVLVRYREMAVWELEQCKFDAWNYLLQKQVRVSLLVQGHHQEQSSGQLWFTFKQHQLPPGFLAPGSIQYVAAGSVASYHASDPITKYYPRNYSTLFGPGQRGTHLGHDIFNIQLSKPLPSVPAVDQKFEKVLPKSPEKNPRISTINEVMSLKRALVHTNTPAELPLLSTLNPLSQEETDRLIDVPIQFENTGAAVTVINLKEIHHVDNSNSTPAPRQLPNQELDGNDLLSLMDS